MRLIDDVRLSDGLLNEGEDQAAALSGSGCTQELFTPRNGTSAPGQHDPAGAGPAGSADG